MHEDNPQASGIQRISYYMEYGLLVLLLAAMIVLSVAQIILRNFFDTGIVWIQPLLGVLVLWIGLAGSIVASRKKNHITVNILSHYLGTRNRHIAETAMMFFTSVVCAILAYHSTRFVQSEYEYASIAFGSIPVWICESIIPVAFALISFRYLAHTLDKLGWPKKGGNQ